MSNDSVDGLPPVPAPTRYFGHSTLMPMYTTDEMRDYARAALASQPQQAVPDEWKVMLREIERALIVYSSLPSDRYPGAPTTALEYTRTMLRGSGA